MKHIKKFNLIFYIFLVLSSLALIFPKEYLYGTYTPRFMGWVLLVSLILSLVFLILLSVFDILNKNYKTFIMRLVISFIVIMAYLIFKKY